MAGRMPSAFADARARHADIGMGFQPIRQAATRLGFDNRIGIEEQEERGRRGADTSVDACSEAVIAVYALQLDSRKSLAQDVREIGLAFMIDDDHRDIASGSFQGYQATV